MPPLIFEGEVGSLEGNHHPSLPKEAPAALILHPHPQHGGTMHSKVVHTLHKAFSAQGFSTLRFNFRGVGQSEGSYADGEGELKDALHAFRFLQALHPQARAFWVAGFSFGAWISLRLLSQQLDVAHFVAVSPPTNLYDFSGLPSLLPSGLIVQGDQDEIVTTESVRQLVCHLQNRGEGVRYSEIPKADHFFSTHLLELRQYVERYVEETRSLEFFDLSAKFFR